MKYQIATKNILGHSLQHEKYHIVGAGVSGLMLGFFLKKKGIPFHIFEKSDKAGGLIQTHHLEGFGRAEQAANGFIWCKEIQEICDAISLDILAPKPSAKARYIVKNKKLSKLPLHFGQIMTAATKSLRPHSGRLETMEDFGFTFLGKTATQQLLEPALGGIYAADIQELSFEGVMPFLAKELNDTNSLFSAVRRFKKQTPKNLHKGTQSFQEGFGAFTARLGAYLQEHISYGYDYTEINTEQPTIITTPAHVAQHFFQGEIQSILSRVRYNPIITSTLFFHAKDVPKLKAGFGCLIPRKEEMKLLGILFNSHIFTHRITKSDQISITCIFRDTEKQYFSWNDDKIVSEIIMPDLKKLFDAQKMPLAHKIFKWENGIPLYEPFLVQNWKNLDKLLQHQYPNIRLLGNYTGQISVRGMAQFIARSVSEI